MPVPDSSLYSACNAVAEFVRDGVQAAAHDIKVYMGPPSDLIGKADEQRLNLFFYRFEPGGFQSAPDPNDPWRIRIFCMVTALGELGDTSGEDDLRMLGLVMSLFHEHPILPLVNINGETIRLQSVFSPTTDEQINQVWSTQGDIAYRASVIYELALAPVMPEVLRGDPPRVGALGLTAHARDDGRFAAFAGVIQPSLHSGLQVSQSNPAWVPGICWVSGDECLNTLAVDVDLVDPADLDPSLWVAGRVGESVNLVWQVWQASDSAGASAWVEVVGSSQTIASAAINPDNIPVALPTVELPPLDTLPANQRWQLLLRASRDYQPVADGPLITLASNPLLISLYRGAA